jgi:hypothetical protein
MKKRRLIYEAPVGDYLSDEFKSQARSAGTTADPREKAQKMMALQRAVTNIPELEKENKKELEELAIEVALSKYPCLKKMVDLGKVIIDAKLDGGSGGRTTKQTIEPEKLRQQKEKTPNFSALEKKRHFQNAQTQGRAWIDGFNSILFVEDELDGINPKLYDAYRDFTKGVSEYYWEFSNMLERGAASGMGRMAYTDVKRNADGTVTIEARAPHFPLLVHEIIKGAEYYKTLPSLPKDPDLRKAITKSADTHRHEIQNMNFGREMVNRLRSIFSSVKGYQPTMEITISSQMDTLHEDEYNEYMDAVANQDKEGIQKLKNFVEGIVKRLI